MKESNVNNKNSAEVQNINEGFSEYLKEQNVKTFYQFDEFVFMNLDRDGLGLGETDVIIVEKEIEGKSGKKISIFEFYKDGQLIATTDEKGVLSFTNEYKKTLAKCSEGYYKALNLSKRKPTVITKEDLERRLEQEEDKKPKDEENKDNEEKKEEDKDAVDPKEIESELGLEEGDIESCTEIVDKRFYDKVPEARGFDGYARLAYSKSRNEFIIIGKDNGKIVEAETIMPGKGTMKTSVDLDSDGNPVTTQSISAILQLKGNNEYDFAVNLNPTGILEFQELRWDDINQKYMSSDLETRGDIRQKTTKEVDDMMKNTTNNDITTEIDKYEDLTRKRRRSTYI